MRLDGPAGTLPVDTAIEAMRAYLSSPDPANVGGRFDASVRTGAMVDEVRGTVGRLLGTAGSQVIFGASSTALMFAYTRALARTWKGGERIVCTQLDHDSNITPWVLAAHDAGAEVTMLPVDRRDGSLDLADLERALAGNKVAWVAMTGASNLTGFAPDLRAASTMSHEAGARLHVDAVARAPHLPIDVDGWGIDSLVTSPYKWYGPHAGILVLQPDLLHGVEPYRVRPADYPGPERWETGTAAFETIAGIGGAAAFMAEHPWDVVTAAETALLDRLESGLRDRRCHRAHADVDARARADDGLHRRRAGAGLGRGRARRSAHRGVERRQLRVRAGRRAGTARERRCGAGRRRAPHDGRRRRRAPRSRSDLSIAE